MPLPELTQPELLELDGYVREAVDSLTLDAAQKDHRKAIAERANEKFKISASDFNKITRQRYEERSSRTTEREQEIVEFDEELMTASRNRR